LSWAQMQLQRLRAFRALMVTGSVTKAAERLRLTQPAVSRSLSALEKDLGFELFSRGRGRLVVTKQGEAFYREAEHILRGIDDFPEIIKNIRLNRNPYLRIVTLPPLERIFVPEVVTRFATEFPSVKVYVESRARRDVESWIAGLHYDIGITALPVHHPGVISHQFASFDTVLVVAPGSPLATKPKVGFEDLADEPFIALDHASLIRHGGDVMFAEANITPNIRFETSSALTAAQLAGNGLGFAFVDPFSASMLGDRIVARPMPLMPKIVYGFVLPADAGVAPLRDRFAEIVTATAAKFGAITPDGPLPWKRRRA